MPISTGVEEIKELVVSFKPLIEDGFKKKVVYEIFFAEVVAPTYHLVEEELV